MVHVIDSLSLCDCCLLKVANDDTSGHDFYCGDEPAPLSALDVEPGASIVPGDDRDEFSRRRCDGCGSTLAGARTDCPVLS